MQAFPAITVASQTLGNRTASFNLVMSTLNVPLNTNNGFMSIPKPLNNNNHSHGLFHFNQFSNNNTIPVSSSATMKVKKSSIHMPTTTTTTTTSQAGN